MKNEPFNLDSAIQDVITLLAPKSEEPSVELIMHYPPTTQAWFVGDGGRIRQVLTNLIGNALKFTEVGHIAVVVDVDPPLGADSCNLTITVADIGCGIPADAQATIFDKFTQADSSSTRQHGGTGLGLAITRMLVEAMGGNISLKSTEGAGSTFTVEISLPVHAEKHPARQYPAGLQGLKVLIVDDVEVNRENLVEHTLALGMLPTSVSTGMAAVAAYAESVTRSEPFTIVLLDYQMPGMNGVDTAKALRQLDASSITSIIMLTSVDNPPGSTAFEEVDLQGFLLKPVNGSELRNELAALAESRRIGVVSERPAHLPEISLLPETDEPEIEGAGRSRPLVLVAEDNAINQKFALEILELAECDRLMAENGQKAIDAYVSERPDIVLMDVSMPVMGGLESTREIRRIEAERGWERCPIVGMTAHAMHGDEEKALHAGMDDYLTKPLKLVAVISKLKKLAFEVRKQADSSPVRENEAKVG